VVLGVMILGRCGFCSGIRRPCVGAGGVGRVGVRELMLLLGKWMAVR